MLTKSIRGVPHAYELIPRQIPPELTESLSEESANTQTLVFIHGWLLSRAYWQPLAQQLSAHFHCLSYDMRGFGESALNHRAGHQDVAQSVAMPEPIELPSGRTLISPHSGEKMETYQASAYSLAAYAKDLESLLDQLGIDQVWLLGHSLGGSVALWAAYLLPERIKGVVCINAGGGIYIENEFEKFRTAGQQMLKYRPSWLAQMPLLPRVFSRVMVQQPLSLRWGQQRVRDFVRADAQAAKGSLLESTTAAEVYLLPQVISQLDQPVHFITATEDSIMPPRYVQYLASFHPEFAEGETVSEIAECGHMAMIEQPERVARIVESVLAGSD
jgi:pimeloyl-ACP methyl ester carboxylesterase